MNVEAFTNAYNESRNGANHFYKNPLYPKFLYSDGVQQLAEAGCYWLIDILGTELPIEFYKRVDADTCIVKITAKNGKAVLVGEFQDNDPTAWRKFIETTDLPNGEWKLFVFDGSSEILTCILPSEY